MLSTLKNDVSTSIFAANNLVVSKNVLERETYVHYITNLCV